MQDPREHTRKRKKEKIKYRTYLCRSIYSFQRLFHSTFSLLVLSSYPPQALRYFLGMVLRSYLGLNSISLSIKLHNFVLFFFLFYFLIFLSSFAEKQRANYVLMLKVWKILGFDLRITFLRNYNKAIVELFINMHASSFGVFPFSPFLAKLLPHSSSSLPPRQSARVNYVSGPINLLFLRAEIVLLPRFISSYRRGIV